MIGRIARSSEPGRPNVRASLVIMMIAIEIRNAIVNKMRTTQRIHHSIRWLFEALSAWRVRNDILDITSPLLSSLHKFCRYSIQNLQTRCIQRGS